MLALLGAMFLIPAAAPESLDRSELRACVGSRRVELSSRWAEVRASHSDVAWGDVCRQVREANARRQSSGRALLATGRSPVGGYGPVSHYVNLSASAPDPVLAELFQRVARDQKLRADLSFVEGRRTYAAGLSPDAYKLLDELVALDVIEADEDNRTWLKEVVARRGWFTISRDGAEADNAAWLIVQHADNDRDFQESMIAQLEPLAAEGQTSWRRLALLHDRWAAGVDRPQMYGNQGRCIGPGQWQPREIAKPEDLDLRRQRAGLSAMIEYVRTQAQRCK